MRIGTTLLLKPKPYEVTSACAHSRRGATLCVAPSLATHSRRGATLGVAPSHMKVRWSH